MYHYRVSSSDGYNSADASFKTAVQGCQPFEFVVFGDTRSDHGAHRAVVAEIIRNNPDFVLNTGDLVNDGYCLDDWRAFFGIERNLMKNAPYMPVIGNHEENSPYYFSFFYNMLR